MPDPESFIGNKCPEIYIDKYDTNPTYYKLTYIYSGIIKQEINK